ncbi:MAG TPA: ABC transporter permease [Candidatus Acidoferrales bacterium]|nr:ABC transporter permease [Candidatus Acidoferrales bacterium]
MKFFSRDDRDSNLNDELQSHMNMDQETRVSRGASPEQAGLDSRREFGNAGLVRETTRDMWGWARFERLAQDVRYALRLFAKTPVVTAVALLSLALGIGANTAIFGLTNALLLRSLPVQNPQELVTLGMLTPTSTSDPNPIFTNPIWEQVRDHQEVFQSAFAWSSQQFDLSQGGESHFTHGIYASGSYFLTLGVKPAAGRLIVPGDDVRGCPGVVVLSYDFWQEQFGGDPGAIGKSISLNRHSFEVIGVSGRGFTGTEVGYGYQVAVPICAEAIIDTRPMLDGRSAWWLQLMARRKPEISPEQLNTRLKVFSKSVFESTVPANWPPDYQTKYRVRFLVAAEASSGVSLLRRAYEKPLQLLMGVVGLVLLIACANIASLMLARASVRRKEIAVRLAVGASRARLIRQLLTECILLSVAGAALGLLFARWGDLLLVRFINVKRQQVFLNLSLDWRMLAFTSAVAVATGVLFGILPAIRSTQVSVASAMKGSQAQDGEPRSRFRAGRWIVASQIALSLVLLVVAGLFVRTFTNLISQDLGFDTGNVTLASVSFFSLKMPPAEQIATRSEVLQRIQAIPGVASASQSVLTPLGGIGWNDNVVIDDPSAPKGDDALVDFNFISPEYMSTLRTPIMEGRNFDKHDVEGSPKVAIVNQAMARSFFPRGNALGSYFKTGDDPKKLFGPIQIVGVMKDAKYGSMRKAAPPSAFFPLTQIPEPESGGVFEIRSNLPAATLLPTLRKVFAEVNGSLPITFQSFSKQIDESVTQERLLATLSGFFGVLGLLLAVIGLYGVMAYLVTRRQKEIGIRMSLGAQRGEIQRMVLRDVAIVLLVGVPVGIGVAAASAKFVKTMLFGLAPRDLTTLFGAAIALAVVAAIAGFFPARRASRVDPMLVLREE